MQEAIKKELEERLERAQNELKLKEEAEKIQKTKIIKLEMESA